MKKYIILLVLFALVFTACEDVIPVKMNKEDFGLFAVEAKITTKNEPFVFLSQGIPVSEDKPFPGISNALITITDDAQPANSVTLAEDTARAGYYTVPEGEEYYGVPGRTYTVIIESQGVTLTASDKLSRVEPIDSIKVWPSLRGDKRFLAVFIYGRETPGIGNYYKWDIYVNDTLLNNAQTLSIASDEFVDGNYVSGLEIFTDFHDPNKRSERKLKYQDTVYVKQTSTSAFAYNFYFQMINQSSTGFLFSVPPANIEGNFTASDGKTVLGLFTAHDLSVSNKVIINDKIESQLDERP